MKMKEIRADERSVDDILREGIECCAEAEIGEVVHCLMDMFKNVKHSSMVKIVKQAVGPEHEEAIDNLLICFFVSEVATLTANFKNREEAGAEA